MEPNASVDRPRPSHAISGEEQLEGAASWKGLPEGGVRGRTHRLGLYGTAIISETCGPTDFGEGNCADLMMREISPCTMYPFRYTWML